MIGTITQKTEDVLVLETNKPAERIGLLFGVAGLFCIGAFAAINPQDSGRNWEFMIAAFILIPTSLVFFSANERIRFDRKLKVVTRHELLAPETTWPFEQLSHIGVAVNTIPLRLSDVVLRRQNGTQIKLGMRGDWDSLIYAVSIATFLQLPVNLPAGKRGTAMLELALRKFPGDCRLLMVRGDRHWQHNDFDRAIADYSAVLKIEPSQTTGYYKRGLAYSEQLKFELALADFAAVVARDNSSADAFCLRGICYWRMKNYQAAKSDFDQSIALRSDHALSYLERGVVFAALGQADAARSDFSAAYSISARHLKYNENAFAHYYCGYALARLGDFEKSFQYFSQFRKLAPRTGTASICMAEFHCLRASANTAQPSSRQADIEEALGLIETAVKLHYNPAQLSHNVDLEILKDHPRFQALCAVT